MKKSRGFTFVELLVALSITAIVMTIGTMAIQGSLKTGRDGKRRGDLKALQNALEQYYSIHNTYPTDLNLLVPTYISAVPKDPKHSINPHYIPATPTPPNLYKYCADTENKGTLNNGTELDECIYSQQ